MSEIVRELYVVCIYVLYFLTDNKILDLSLVTVC